MLRRPWRRGHRSLTWLLAPARLATCLKYTPVRRNFITPRLEKVATDFQPSAAGWSGLRRVLWDARSIRAQLIIVFALIEFAAALVAGSCHHPQGADVHAGRNRRLDGARRTAGERGGAPHAAGGPRPSSSSPTCRRDCGSCGTSASRSRMPPAGRSRCAARSAAPRWIRSDERSARHRRWFAALIAPREREPQRAGDGQRRADRLGPDRQRTEGRDCGSVGEHCRRSLRSRWR